MLYTGNLIITKQSFIHKYLLSLTPASSLTVLASAKAISITTTAQKGHRHAGPLPSVGVPHQKIRVSIAHPGYPFPDISQTNALWLGFVNETRLILDAVSSIYRNYLQGRPRQLLS